MLYLVTPTNVQWINLPAATTLSLTAEHGTDLGRLPWEPAERRLDPDLIRLALRHGTPCSTGIAIDAGLVVQLGRGDHLRQAHYDAQRAQEAIRPHEQAMDQLFPGWIEHGAKLDRRIAETSDRLASEADQDAAELLAGDPDPRLVEHWRRLGGQPVE